MPTPNYNWVSSSTYEEDLDTYPIEGPVRVKFTRTLNTSYLTNTRFSLERLSPSPAVISNPFHDINLSTDYDSLSRVLSLYHRSVLTPEAQYRFTVSGLRDISGNQQLTAENYIIDFTTEADADATPSGPVQPVPIDIIDIEDVIIGPDGTVSALRVEEVNPQAGSVVTASENRGVVKVFFSQNLDSSSVAGNVTVQKRSVSIAPASWSTVSATTNVIGSLLEILLPSSDATPVYDTANRTYFTDKTEYRFILSANIKSTEDLSLDTGVAWSIFGPLALAIDPAYISSSFPDVASEEIVRAIWIKTQELEKLSVDLTTIEAINYVLYAALCYLQGTVGIPLDASSVRLGDLEVVRSGRFTSAESSSDPCTRAIFWWDQITRGESRAKKFNPRIDPSPFNPRQF